jgi:hypothetical protein
MYFFFFLPLNKLLFAFLRLIEESLAREAVIEAVRRRDGYRRSLLGALEPAGIVIAFGET